MTGPAIPTAVRNAADWLASLDRAEKPHPIIPALRRRFDLTPAEAVAAIREANLIHARAT